MKSTISIFLALLSITSAAQNPMIVPTALDGGTYQLTLQTGTHEFYPGITSNTMGVNGSLLGPTLIMEAGENVDVTFDNQLGETTTIHWHGMHVSAANDGGPHTVINAGSSWNPQFTVLDKAATYWYHPHLHEKTNEHVLKGIAGFVIVQDSEEAALDLPRTYGEDDFPIALQTKAIDGSGQIAIQTEMDTSVLANGTVDAYLDLPAQVVRLRLLNGASQRAFNIALSNSNSFHQIASDGGLLSAPVEMSELLLAPGERAEILIDLSGMEGQSFGVVNLGANIPNNVHGAETVSMMGQSIGGYNDNPLNGGTFDLFQVNVGAQTASPVTAIPSSLVQVMPYLESDADTTRNVYMYPVVMGPVSMIEGPFQFDDAPFDMNIINQTIPLGNTEVWTIYNQTGIAHPFHIHDVQFSLLEVNGSTPPANQQGWKDVVLVPGTGSARFITKFDDFADNQIPYMYHCHMLTHEDEGMMGQFLVVDGQTSIGEKSTVVSIYPNPAINGSVRISSVVPMEKLEQYGLDGRLIDSKQLKGESQYEFSLPDHSESILIRILTANGELITKQIVNPN